MMGRISSNLFVAYVLFIRTELVLALRADWKNYLDPELYAKYAGKPADHFNNSLFQGDIDRIDADQSMDEFSQYAANVIKDEKYRWPDNTVPYTLSNTFTEKEKKLIRGAMDAMTELTDGCIEFKLKENEEDYIKIVRGMGCYSSVGRQGGDQTVSVTRGCLDELGDVQHELMHALGFYHEQSRMDRDQYITIDFENVKPNSLFQFQKFDGYTFGLPYDYSSVLHYVWNAFAISPDSPTIIGNTKGAKIGQKANLSALDVKRIRMAYGCEKKSAGGFPKETEAPTTKKPRTKPATTTPAEEEEDVEIKLDIEEEDLIQPTTVARKRVKVTPNPRLTKKRPRIQVKEDISETAAPKIIPTKTLKCPENKVSFIHARTVLKTLIPHVYHTKKIVQKTSRFSVTYVPNYDDMFPQQIDLAAGQVRSVETTMLNDQTLVLHSLFKSEPDDNGGMKLQESYETMSWHC